MPKLGFLEDFAAFPRRNGDQKAKYLVPERLELSSRKEQEARLERAIISNLYQTVN